ncbi:MAG: hypothetical protein IPJ85_01730 [Flavobacteriales bacterium]|nr:hypothetical protein [Flavobacteriales bacterium]
MKQQAHNKVMNARWRIASILVLSLAFLSATAQQSELDIPPSDTLKQGAPLPGAIRNGTWKGASASSSWAR